LGLGFARKEKMNTSDILFTLSIPATIAGSYTATIHTEKKTVWICLFLLGSTIQLIGSFVLGSFPLILLNLYFVFLNLYGIYGCIKK